MRSKLIILFQLLLAISLLQLNVYADNASRITILNYSDSSVLIIIDKNTEIVNNSSIAAGTQDAVTILGAIFSLIKNLLNYIVQNSLSLFFIAFIIILAAMFRRYWKTPDEDIVIMPFEVVNTDNKYNGKALSDLLFAELQRIKHISSNKYEGIENEELGKSEVAGKEKTIISGEELSKLGNFGIGSASVSIGEFMIIIKKLFRDNNCQSIINGSLDNCGQNFKLIACIKGNQSCTWEIQPKKDNMKQNASIDDFDREAKNDNESIFISDLVRDLSYRILFKLSEKNISAKTLLGFEHYTEALNGYHQYILTKQINWLESSRENCLKAVKIENNYKKTLGLFFNLGNAYFNEKMYDKSEEMFIKALELDPKLASAWVNKGAALGNLGKNEEAVKAYDEAIKLDPKIALAWSNKGNALGNISKHDEAIEAYDKAISLDAKDANAWIGKSVTLNKQGKYDEAIICIAEAIRLNPNDPSAWLNKGVALGNLSKNEEAVKAYDEAIKLDPKLAFAWSNKGNALLNLGKNEEAVKACDEAIKLDPKLAFAWSNKGDALRNLGKNEEAVKAYEEAVKAYDEAIRLNLNDAYAWNGKSDALSNMGKYDEAIKCIDETIRLAPKLAIAWVTKGEVLGKQGMYDEAIKAYDEAIKLDSKLALAWYNKGTALKSLGHVIEAEAALANAKELGHKRLN